MNEPNAYEFPNKFGEIRTVSTEPKLNIAQQATVAAVISNSHEGPEETGAGWWPVLWRATPTISNEFLFQGLTAVEQILLMRRTGAPMETSMAQFDKPYRGGVGA